MALSRFFEQAFAVDIAAMSQYTGPLAASAKAAVAPNVACCIEPESTICRGGLAVRGQEAE